MTRLGILGLMLLLFLGIVHAAMVSVSSSTSGTIATPIGEASANASIKGNIRVDHVPPNVRVVAAERTEGHVKLTLSVQLPNPCYSVRTSYRAVDEGNYYNLEVYLNMVEPQKVCVQVIQFMEMNMDLNVPGDKPVEVSIISKKIVEENKEKIVKNVGNVMVESTVPYEAEIENNVLIVKLKGCYNYEVVPMKCPNCYTVYIEKSDGCGEAETEVRLKIIPGFKGVVKVTFKGEVRENEEEICGKIRAIASEYNEELGMKVEEACARGGIERACEVLKELNVPGTEIVCAVNEGNVPVIAGIQRLIEAIKNYAPDVAMELEVLYREGKFWELKDKACGMLKEKNEELYNKICKELNVPTMERIKEMVRERVRERVEANYRQELNKGLQRIREEIEKHKGEIKELKLNIRELKRKIMITPRGIIDVESNQEINVPKAVVQVRVKKRAIVIQKEDGKIVMEVNGPVRVRVKVKVPIEVEENAIVVKGKPIKVLPDEVIQRIRERLRAEKVEEIELEEEENKVVYKVKVRARGRLLFLIPVEVPEEVYVDAETGAEIKIQRPWWAFLVFG